MFIRVLQLRELVVRAWPEGVDPILIWIASLLTLVACSAPRLFPLAVLVALCNIAAVVLAC